MRTNIEIDDKLMRKVMQISGAKTKRAAVEDAMQHRVKGQLQEGIREWFGKVEWEGDLESSRLGRGQEESS